MTLLPDTRHWDRHAACKGADPIIFHPPVGIAPTYRAILDDQARTYCNRCPVRAECREHGIEHEPYGTWGGLPEGERDRIRWIDKGYTMLTRRRRRGY